MCDQRFQNDKNHQQRMALRHSVLWAKVMRFRRLVPFLATRIWFVWVDCEPLQSINPSKSSSNGWSVIRDQHKKTLSSLSGGTNSFGLLWSHIFEWIRTTCFQRSNLVIESPTRSRSRMVVLVFTSFKSLSKWWSLDLNAKFDTEVVHLLFHAVSQFYSSQ
jgi:hypothetical protein